MTKAVPYGVASGTGTQQGTPPPLRGEIDEYIYVKGVTDFSEKGPWVLTPQRTAARRDLKVSGGHPKET